MLLTTALALTNLSSGGVLLKQPQQCPIDLFFNHPTQKEQEDVSVQWCFA